MLCFIIYFGAYINVCNIDIKHCTCSTCFLLLAF